MSILVRFTGAPGTEEKYDETIRRLESAGDFPPDGLEYHVAFNSGGHFRVSEIWDSREQFEAFGQRLMPMLDDVGIELAGEPEILEVYNIIKR
jgi:quinol monooxygenase YgiN